jgi:Ca-activated chloride channel homolog
MNLSEFHFLRPYWLLAVIPLLVLMGLMLKNKLKQGNWSNVCDVELLPYILQEKAVKQSYQSVWLVAITGFLIIVALAGPTWERLPTPVFRNASALVIILDLSKSMDAADIKPSRLIRARYKIADVLKRRKDGQTALIVYAGEAFTVTPLTEDNKTINSQLSALTTSIMPSQGSNPSAALQKAVDLFKQAGLQQGNILLITDAVAVAKTLKIVKSLGAYKLSILGVGTAAGAPINVQGGGFLKDNQGNIVVPKLNISELRKLAKAGGGIYQNISTDDQDIEAILAYVEQQATLSSDAQDNELLLDKWEERGPWLLLLVIPLAALSFRRGILSISLLLLLPMPQNSYALEWDDLWRNADQQGQKAFQQKQYQRAAGQFKEPQWKAAAQYKAGQYQQVLETLQNLQDSNSWYNKGNAYAQLGQYQQALAAYNKTLELDPDNEDAKYNKELIEKELQKQKQQQQSQEKNKDQQQKDDQSGEQQQGDNDKQSENQQQNKENSQQDTQESKSSETAADEQQNSQQEEAQQQAEQQSVEQENKEAEEPEEEPQNSQEMLQTDQETQQANEQWLKRIPDDPAGLLRRKFQYQYGRRQNKSKQTEAW